MTFNSKIMYPRYSTATVAGLPMRVVTKVDMSSSTLLCTEKIPKYRVSKVDIMPFVKYRTYFHSPLLAVLAIPLATLTVAVEYDGNIISLILPQGKSVEKSVKSYRRNYAWKKPSPCGTG